MNLSQALANPLIKDYKYPEEKRITKNFQNPSDKSLTVNVQLLRKVQRALLKDARSFDMKSFSKLIEKAAYRSPYINEMPTEILLKPEEIKEAGHPCFTTACIGGWACFLKRDPAKGGPGLKHISNIRARAEDDLGLTELQAQKLFYFKDWNFSGAGGWPKIFSNAYLEPNSVEDRFHNARIAVERIERFIQTKCKY